MTLKWNKQSISLPYFVTEDERFTEMRFMVVILFTGSDVIPCNTSERL